MSKKPEFGDIKCAIDSVDTKDVNFELKELSSGSLVLKIDGKNSGYFNQRKYGIGYEHRIGRDWTTEKLRTQEQLVDVVSNIFNPQQSLVTNVFDRETVEQSDNFAMLIPEKFKYFSRKMNVRANMTDIETFELWMDQGKNILLIGPTGSGKTTLPRYFCAKHNRPYVRISLNGGCTIEDLVGHYIAKGREMVWVNGLLTIAVKNGYVIVIDEINAAPSEIMFILNSLLDDERILILSSKDGETITPHPDFRLVATCNPTELGYAGTQEINESLLDRFTGSTMYVDYNTSVEHRILKEMNLPNDDIIKVENFTKAIRNAQLDGDILTPFSTRAVMSLAELYMQEMESLIIYRFKENERTIVSDQIDMLIHTDIAIGSDPDGDGSVDVSSSLSS